MTNPNDTIRVLIPLKVRKKNGRPKILPPADYRPSADRIQDPHILRALARAWEWRRCMEAGEFATIRELAEAVGLAERHVSRQLRLAYLAPVVLKRLTCGAGGVGRQLLRSGLSGGAGVGGAAAARVRLTTDVSPATKHAPGLFQIERRFVPSVANGQSEPDAVGHSGPPQWR